MENEIKSVAWGDQNLPPDDTVSFRCGDLAFEVATGAGEIALTSWRNVDGNRAGETSARWAVPKGREVLQITPGMPKLPVLVEPESPFHVLPGASARAYLQIPVSVILKFGSGGWLLDEFPSSPLSETWFGELESGELCYWLATGLSRKPFENLPGDRIQAPVYIQNDSAETLQVTRLCLRVAHLSIYQQADQLWASETNVRFQGGSGSSNIDIQSGPPPEAGDAGLVGEPREKGPASRVGRTFRSLRKWTTNLLDVD